MTRKEGRRIIQVDETTGEILSKRQSAAALFPGNKYVQINQIECSRIAAELGHQSRQSNLAVFMSALGKANDAGHAEFDSGELRRLAGVKDDGAVRRALVPLTAAGMVSPESNPRCVWLNRDLVTRKRQGGKVPECRQHQTRATWNPRDLSPFYLEG